MIGRTNAGYAIESDSSGPNGDEIMVISGSANAIGTRGVIPRGVNISIPLDCKINLYTNYNEAHENVAYNVKIGDTNYNVMPYSNRNIIVDAQKGQIINFFNGSSNESAANYWYFRYALLAKKNMLANAGNIIISGSGVLDSATPSCNPSGVNISMPYDCSVGLTVNFLEKNTNFSISFNGVTYNLDRNFSLSLNGHKGDVLKFFMSSNDMSNGASYWTYNFSITKK